jgi:hypothetical protein
MIGTLRKHSQGLWIIIIIVVCISFVYFFTPEVDQIGSGAAENFGELYGEPITRKEMQSAAMQARIAIFLQFRQWPDSGALGRQLEQSARQRLFLNRTAEKEGIHVSDEQVGAYIKAFFVDPETRKFSKGIFENVLQNLAAVGGVTDEAFFDYARSQVALQHLQQVNSLAGSLISTRAAEALYRRENEQMEAAVVFVATSNQVAQVKITTNAIATYFTNNSASFRIPERVVVNYVFFDFADSNYVAGAEKVLAANTNLATLLDEQYAERGTNAFRNAEGEVMSAEDAKKQLRDDLLDTEAGKIGQAASIKFANEVFKIRDVKAENLSNIAKKMGYAVKESKPFTELDGPEDLDAPANFANVAFGLSPDEPLGGPLNGIKGTYLVSYNRRLASEIPQLTNVWDDVVADYQRSQARELTVQAGNKLAGSLTKGLAAGKVFEDLIKTNGVDSVEVPSFTRSTRTIPQVEQFGLTSREFIRVAFDLEAGYASGFRRSGNGGYVVFVKKRTPAKDAQVTADLPDFLEGLRQDRQGLAFQDWFQSEFIKSGLAMTEPGQ